MIKNDLEHCLANITDILLHHAKNVFSFTSQAAPAVEYLIHSYPEFVSVDSLPYCSVTEKVGYCTIYLKMYTVFVLISAECLKSRIPVPPAWEWLLYRVAMVREKSLGN